MKKYKEKLIERIEFSELDFEEPHWSEGEEDANDIEYLDAVETETTSINIDLAISTLKNLKEKGADSVYIYQHVDHIGYIFTGSKFELV